MHFKIFFFHLHLFDGICFQYLLVSFSPSILIFSWFGSFIMCHFPLLIISMARFSMPNSIIISWLYILTVSIRVSISFSLLTNSLMPSMYIRWLIFSCDLVSLYSPVHFLSMWLSPCNSFSMFNIYSFFLWWSLQSHILHQNYFASLASVCWYVFAHSPPTRL